MFFFRFIDSVMLIIERFMDPVGMVPLVKCLLQPFSWKMSLQIPMFSLRNIHFSNGSCFIFALQTPVSDTQSVTLDLLDFEISEELWHWLIIYITSIKYLIYTCYIHRSIHISSIHFGLCPPSGLPRLRQGQTGEQREARRLLFRLGLRAQQRPLTHGWMAPCHTWHP